MAKLKFSPRQNSKRDAFYMTGNLFDLDPTDSEPTPGPRHQPASGNLDLESEIHPSIANFVMNSRKTAPRESLSPRSDLELELTSQTETLNFITFGSGSSGNCAYLGTRTEGILIDAGVHADTVKEQLRIHGLSTRNIKGIILTHDHTDHVKYVYPLIKKRTDIGIYCTPKTLSGMLRRHSISRRIKDYHRPIYKAFEFSLGPFRITPFDVSHDGTDNVGYYIEFSGGTTMAVATDLGCITPRVDHYMRLANHIVIESNYDARMLANGPYPMHLKARIAADNGHLDNTVTASFLASIASEKLRSVYLCHLSQDNNLPELAVETSLRALAEAGFTQVGDATGSIESRACPLQLTALPRTSTSLLFTLR